MKSPTKNQARAEHGAVVSPSAVVTVEGQEITVNLPSMVLSALHQANRFATRQSGDGARGPCCGMAVCQECRVRINGQVMLACITPLEPHMEIQLHHD